MQTDIDAIVEGGRDTGVSSGLAVSETTPASMGVHVAAGESVNSGTRNTITAGDLVIGAAHASYYRIDLVVIAADGAKTIRAGVAASRPKAPAMTTGDVLLAYVLVRPGATTIEAVYLTDKRVPLADHGSLYGLGDDDHPQYLTAERAGDILEGLGFTNDHGSLIGLGDDDHPQYHNDARALSWLGGRSTSDLPEGSRLYFTNTRADDRAAFVIAGLGLTTDHGSLGGLADDDHSQYLLLAGRGSEQDVTGGLTVSTYARIGSAATPANTTAGDLTAERISIGDVQFTNPDPLGIVDLTSSIVAMSPTFTNTSGTTPIVHVGATLAPASNSTAQFRLLNFISLINGAGNMTGTIYGAFFTNRIGSSLSGTLTQVNGIYVNGLYLFQSPAAGGGAITTTRGILVEAAQAISGVTRTITNITGIDVNVLSPSSTGTTLTTTTAIGIAIRNPAAAFAALTTQIGLFIEAQTRGTTGLGIRNDGNSVQVGYARFGANTAPTNVTDGDVTMSRLLVANSDTAIALNALVYVNQNSVTPGASAYSTFAGIIRWTPNGGDSANARDGFNFQMFVRPSANSDGLYRGWNLLLSQDSGAFNLTNAESMTGFAVFVRKDVAGTTALIATFNARPRVQAGTVTDYKGFWSRGDFASGTVTTLRHFTVEPNSAPASATTVVGLNVNNLGAAGITTAVGIDLAAQSGATTNFGIRNAGNLVQTGYARFGAVTAGNNTTDGDLTATRLHIGNLQNSFVTDQAVLIRQNATGTSGSSNIYTQTVTVAPASNSSATLRAFYGTLIVNAATGITQSSINHFVMESYQRQDGAVTSLTGVNVLALGYDSSSAATPGTITNVNGIFVNLFNRLSGTSAGAVTNLAGIDIRGPGAAGLTVTIARGIWVENPTASTITTYVGLDLEKFTRATTNIGIRNASTLVNTPSTVQTIAAGTAIVADATIVQIQSTGSVTVTAAPTIANGQDGQELTIVNVDSADTITLQDQGTLASSNLRLVATTIALAPRQSVKLIYSSTVGDWIQAGPVVAVI